MYRLCTIHKREGKRVQQTRNHTRRTNQSKNRGWWWLSSSSACSRNIPIYAYMYKFSDKSISSCSFRLTRCLSVCLFYILATRFQNWVTHFTFLLGHYCDTRLHSDIFVFVYFLIYGRSVVVVDIKSSCDGMVPVPRCEPEPFCRVRK